MVKYRPHITFLILMIVYFLVRYFRADSNSVFLSHYFTDLLFVPAMCTFALIFTRIFKRDNEWIIPLHFVLIQTILVSFYFEWYLPKYHGKPGWYTADEVDVIMYFIGALIFVLIQFKFFRIESTP